MSEKSPLVKITDDIYQLQIPLPFALNIVNVYLLRGEEGWTIVDTGLNTDRARETWQYAFDTLKITPRDIEKIVLTHCHPDHFGMAGWLQGLADEAGHDIPIYVSPKENEQVERFWKGTFNIGGWIKASGASDELAQEVQESTDWTRSHTRPHPRPLTEHNPGDPIRLGSRDFQTIHAPGHSDGQMLFYDPADKLILSGDQVLMKITPNIGKWLFSPDDPLGLFLDSLRELHNLDVRLALPGHKWLIEDWKGRIEELIAHHDTRLQHCIDALADGPQKPMEVAKKIFPTERFSVHEWRFAVAETFAHLEYLAMRDKIQCDSETRLFSHN